MDNDTASDRYWEVWDKKHVMTLEERHWGTAGTKKSGGRHHALNKMVADFVPEGASILEVAPGQGHFYGILKEEGKITEYHGRDTSPDMRERFHELFPEAEILHGDVYDLSEQPMADCVIAIDLLMHLPTNLTVPIQQMWSRVKSGGTLLITMRHPDSDKESWIVERNYISDKNTADQGKRLVVRGMRRDEFIDIIRSLGNYSAFVESIYDERTSTWVIKKK